MSDHKGNRASDEIILEIHRMVGEMSSDLKNHIKKDEDVQAAQAEEIKDVRSRLAPVESFHETAKDAGTWVKWALKYMSIPILSGLGIATWAWIQHGVSHVKVP